MFKALFKPLGLTQLLKSGGRLEYSTAHHIKFSEEEYVVQNWTAGYISRILHEDFKNQILSCWTEQEGQKELFEAMYKEMRNPYTHVFDYAKVRNETIYPMIKLGLQDCKDGALEAFEAI